MNLSEAVTTSLWLDRLDPPIERRAPLGARPEAADADVAIIGGGFSGLWTAYYLIRADPSLRITLIERDFCGFGASGRNGGWAIGEVAGPLEWYARRATQAEAMRLARAVFDAVDEIGRVSEAEGVDCHYAKGGTIRIARNRPQAMRQRDEIAHHRAWGFTDDEIRLLTADEATDHIGASRVHSGIFLAPSAALDPARLVRGLAEVVERAGVRIVEETAVTEFESGRVVTDQGDVRAEVVVRATEAYTRDLKGHRRNLLPVYSLMVATEPLTSAQLAEVRLDHRPTFADDRFMVIYGQRTADDRIAFGGRGVPYLFGSRIARSAELHQPSHELIAGTLVDLLPALEGIGFTHRWGGVLGIPRNWIPGLTFDRRNGFGVLGGYVGEGVAASNLAGRTMAELIVGDDTDRTSLPWVGATARRWEPEPLRWLGIRSSRTLLAAADEREDTTDRQAKLAYTVSRLLRGGGR
ncbi:MAG: FAD-binding oxidoreductase [Acidimicrobiia bacterium]|nr:FAD-binding oxidoreductase [Acidimicrobiia bacterium]